MSDTMDSSEWRFISDFLASLTDEEECIVASPRDAREEAAANAFAADLAASEASILECVSSIHIAG